MSDIPDTLYRADWLPNHTMAEINIWRGPSTEYTRTALTVLRDDLKIAALVEAAILDAQLRALESGRIDTPDEIRAAAIAAWDGK